MAIDLQQVINSSFGLRLVSLLGRTVPPALGHPFAAAVADRFARRNHSALVRAMRSNQWIVRGESPDREALDRAVRAALRQSARSVFDLYHYLHDLDSVGRLIVLDPGAQELINRSEFEGRGLVVAGLHLSNFDLCLQWMCRTGMQAMVFTIPDPQGARRMEFERRRQAGMNLVPASASALRSAVKYLQQGGLVVTGIDRPIAEPAARPCFFGRPAALPLHHVYMATLAQVPIQVVVVNLQADGKYHVLSSDPIEMDPYPDRDMGALRNGEKVLRIAGQFIRQTPEQWSVPLPVWPDALGLAPGQG
ncbi:MAG: lysophospholipid acyltransferase family protein [Bacteroidota bacterium]